MITEERVEGSLNWLAKNTASRGEARGRVEYLKKREKPLLADLKTTANAKTNAEREDHAYRHKRYEEWLQEYRIAVKEYELLNAEWSARESIISVWQTQQKSMTKTI